MQNQNLYISLISIHSRMNGVLYSISLVLIGLCMGSFMAVIILNPGIIDSIKTSAQEQVSDSSKYADSTQLPEKSSPADRIQESQIHVYNNKVTIDIKDPEWASFTDTNSMDPVLDSSANAIEIVPKNPEEINIGDIVSYESSYADGTIIHRVVKKGYDNDGWYAIMKGDNVPTSDPGKIRFSQIKRVVVAIVY